MEKVQKQMRSNIIIIFLVIPRHNVMIISIAHDFICLVTSDTDHMTVFPVAMPVSSYHDHRNCVLSPSSNPLKLERTKTIRIRIYVDSDS